MLGRSWSTALSLELRWQNWRLNALGRMMPTVEYEVPLADSGESRMLSAEGLSAELDVCRLSAFAPLGGRGARAYWGGCLLASLRTEEFASAPEMTSVRRWAEFGVGLPLGIDLDNGLFTELQPGVLLTPFPKKIKAAVSDDSQSWIEGRLLLIVGWRLGAQAAATGPARAMVAGANGPAGLRTKASYDN